MARLLLTPLALLVWVTGLAAAELILRWDFPADFTPAPTSFLVTYRSSNAPTSPQQFRIPNLGRASCDGLPQASDLTADSICGRPPDCLVPGIYAFSVQAESGEQRSSDSPIATCEALPGCTYRCEGVALPPALQQWANGQQNGSLPDPQAVKQVVETLAQVPTPAMLPSVTTAASTTTTIADQVQTALNQMPKAPV